uniref:Septin-type G domain-containing protein n=1 Tax=Pseudo-nitzschia australis TaxID=44445 RepID=A0A6U9ZJ14_9STRA
MAIKKMTITNTFVRFRDCCWLLSLLLLWHVAIIGSRMGVATAADFSSSLPKTTASSPLLSPTTTMMGSPESIKLRPRVVSLNIMVAGLAGLGKTTTVRALLEAWTSQQIYDEEQNETHRKTKFKNSNAKNNRQRGFISSLSSVIASPSLSTAGAAAPRKTSPTKTPSKAVAFGSTKAIVPSAPFEYFDEEANTILRVRIIDTPGFGNRVNHRNSVRPITNYITECRRERLRRQQSPSAASAVEAPPGGEVFTVGEEDHTDEENLIHVCLYFLSPGRFLAIDRHFLKHVQDEVTIVPVIAKADTMTDSEIARYRAELEQIWRDESIDVYSLDDHYHPSSTKQQRLKNRPHRETSSSNNNKFHRGRRSGEVLAIVSRDGIYPWGHSCALDLEHSDLLLIRDSLLSEHTERFLELANQKYSVYRNQQLVRQKRSDILKYMALVGLATVQLGRIEIAGLTLRAVASRWASAVAQTPLFQQSMALLQKLFRKRRQIRIPGLAMRRRTNAATDRHSSEEGDSIDNGDTVLDQDQENPQK